MDCKYIIFGISLIFLFIVTGPSVSAYKFEKPDFVTVEVSRQVAASASEQKNRFSFDIDYKFSQGDGPNDKPMIFHNKDARQQTIKTLRGDLWSTDFTSPDRTYDVDGWLVKTAHDALKVKNNNLQLNGKSIKLETNCSSEVCKHFEFHLPNNIKKGTYQVVYFLGDEANQYRYTDKVVIK